MSNRRKLVPFWVPLLFGLMGFFNIVGKPRLATLHGSDVLQLIAVGMCFGVALATLVVFFRGPRVS
jgi:hypothetical protein